jgi:uncharacterized protein YjbI with pentapeptide repeats
LETVDACDARFAGALMSQSQSNACPLMGTSFEGTRGLGILLQNSDVFAAILNGPTLANSALTGWTLAEACRREADLRGSDLDGSVLLPADLSGAKLKDADPRGADLGPVDLDRLGALSGAVTSHAQAERILVEPANVVVRH